MQLKKTAPKVRKSLTAFIYVKVIFRGWFSEVPSPPGRLQANFMQSVAWKIFSFSSSSSILNHVTKSCLYKVLREGPNQTKLYVKLYNKKHVIL